jgi:ectoine hydroxylase-related dioxygenase (phytanoyl-CoA dioxygenase family)
MQVNREELNIYGLTDLGLLLSNEEVHYFREDLLAKKRQDIQEYGREYLMGLREYEKLRDLARFGGRYIELLEHPPINNFINYTLNDKAVITAYDAVITTESPSYEAILYTFHRDHIPFRDIRVSVSIIIHLSDNSVLNGVTEYVPSSHLFLKRPSEKFMEKNKVSMASAAGQAFAMDAAVWHRAGANRSGQPRIIIIIQYVLAPFKQQIDFCESNRHHLDKLSDLVKQRLGWNARSSLSAEDYRIPHDKKRYQSGLYDGFIDRDDDAVDVIRAAPEVNPRG